jgi:hypothetical protein
MILAISLKAAHDQQRRSARVKATSRHQDESPRKKLRKQTRPKTRRNRSLAPFLGCQARIRCGPVNPYACLPQQTRLGRHKHQGELRQRHTMQRSPWWRLRLSGHALLFREVARPCVGMRLTGLYMATRSAGQALVVMGRIVTGS